MTSPQAGAAVRPAGQLADLGGLQMGGDQTAGRDLGAVRSLPKPSSVLTPIEPLQPLGGRRARPSAPGQRRTSRAGLPPGGSAELVALREQSVADSRISRGRSARQRRGQPARRQRLAPRPRRCESSTPGHRRMAAADIGDGGQAVLAAGVQQASPLSACPASPSRTTSRRTTDLAPRFLASAGSSICSQTATLKPARISLAR